MQQVTFSMIKNKYWESLQFYSLLIDVIYVIMFIYIFCINCI